MTNVTNPRSQVNRHKLYEKTLIRRGATVGANATLVCGLEIGRYAFIAAGAVVAKNVPDYALMVGVPGRQCGCGQRGCAEAYVSATGFKRTVFALLAERLEESELRQTSFGALTADRVSALARTGDVIALAALEVTGRYLGRLMANLAAAFDPEAIILGGGLVGAGDLLMEPARRAFMESALKRYTATVRILVSPSNEGQMAILGASRCARQTGVTAEAS